MMDNATHALLGACGGIVVGDIAGASVWSMALCGALAGQMPDLDIISSRGSDIYYMLHHRGVSHGVFMLPIEALFFAGRVWFFFKQSFWVTFWTAMAALLLHIFTDVFNSYGTKILWPLSQKRYAWDLLEVCDVYLLIVLAVGTAGGLFFSPIWSYIALGLLAGYIVLRFFLHKWAKSIAQKELPEEIWRIAVLPKLRAMKWNFIAISDECYYLGQVCLYARKMYIVNRYDRPLLEEWDDTKRMRAFEAFSRFPYCYYEEESKSWMDMRYGLYKKNKGPLKFKIRDEKKKK